MLSSPLKATSHHCSYSSSPFRFLPRRRFTSPTQRMTDSTVTHTGAFVRSFVRRRSLSRARVCITSHRVLTPPKTALIIKSALLSSARTRSDRDTDALSAVIERHLRQETTVSKTDGSRKYPRRCGLDKRTRWRFERNCTTRKASFNTCKCLRRPRTGTY